MRRCCAVLVLCALCLGVSAWPVAHAERIEKDGIAYEIADGKAMVAEFLPGVDSVTYHAEVNGYPVQYETDYEEPIRPDAPSEAKELIIAEGVTAIEDRQFWGWRNLEHLVLPSTLQTIGEYAFDSAESLREVILPEGLTQLGTGAFNYCHMLERVVIPSTLVEMGTSVFRGAYLLTAFSVAERNPIYRSVDGVIYTTDGTRLVNYPEGKWGPYEILEGTEEIEQMAFGWRAQITSLKVPPSITKLGIYTVGQLLFAETIYLPATLTEIEDGALPRYGALKAVEIDPDNPVYHSEDGIPYKGSEMLVYPYSHSLSVEIPKGSTEVEDAAYSHHDVIQTVSIPRGVTRIGGSAFNQCTALERVSLPITLEEIDGYAFSDCIMLSGLTLPPALKRIGDGAFSNCVGLASLVIPDSVEEIGAYAFAGMREDFVLIGAKGGAAFWYARENDTLWSEPGGTPALVSVRDRDFAYAVVNNSDAETKLNLRSGPSESNKIIDQFPNGTTVIVLDTEGTWAHVKVAEQEGYMTLNRLMMTDPLTCVVEPTWGRIRREFEGTPLVYAEPWEGSESWPAPLEESIRIIDTAGTWFYVLVGDKEGYIPVQNMEVGHKGDWDDERSVSMVVSPNSRDRLHLRKSPSTGGESLGRYFNGTQVEVLEYGEEWSRVRVDGKEGYMMTQFLQHIPRGGDAGLWGFG